MKKIIIEHFNNPYNIKTERIVRLWKLCYIKLFDDNGFIMKPEQYDSFQDTKGLWDCRKIFWRFYWCNIN